MTASLASEGQCSDRRRRATSHRGADAWRVLTRGRRPHDPVTTAPLAIDNEIYDRLGTSWWNDESPLALLHGSMTAGRMGYFREVLARLGRLPTVDGGSTALDIGSGGGFLAEEFCRLGFTVTGVDPSRVSVETAQAHAFAGELDIRYRVGSGEYLPVDDAGYDVACCSDVLEHVEDVDQVLAETARALRPGGIFFFDTPNRTLASRVVTKATQNWRITRVVDFSGHDWRAFLPPSELTRRAAKQGMTLEEVVGLGPRAPIRTALAAYVGLRRGKLTYRQVSERLDMGRTRSSGFFYMGYAIRR
jgi:2-polyprenyl-6-hydroxyphenyl methylase / 3-demethylubiquinone-9 3-methyltransferase